MVYEINHVNTGNFVDYLKRSSNPYDPQVDNELTIQRWLRPARE